MNQDCQACYKCLTTSLIWKFSLNKKNISNLSVAEMSKHVGGSVGYGTCYHCGGGGGYPQKTKNGSR